MSDKAQQPLPFIYQFAAGAVAGVSEVCISHPIQWSPIAHTMYYSFGADGATPAILFSS